MHEHHAGIAALEAGRRARKLPWIDGCKGARRTRSLRRRIWRLAVRNRARVGEVDLRASHQPDEAVVIRRDTLSQGARLILYHHGFRSRRGYLELAAGGEPPFVPVVVSVGH